jgi:RHS repeat-associated protein
MFVRRGVDVGWRVLSGAVAGLMFAVLLVVAAPDRASASDLLPFTVTNTSGATGATFVYVMARDQASGVQGWVDGAGTWHAFNLPSSVPVGTPPPAAPDTSIAGPATGSSATIYLRPGLVAGRIYMSFGSTLHFFLTPNGLVEPAGWVPTDPNHDVLYDWVEFARDGSRLFINTTMVDMFSVPLSVSVTHSDGSHETQGRLVNNGRSKIFSELASSGWSGLIQSNSTGSLPLRAIAPVHAIEQGLLSPTYFAGYVDAAWSYYAGKPLTVTTVSGSFTGRVSGSSFVFRDAGGTTVASFAKPSTTDIFACQGAVQPTGQPNQTAALAIGARLCAAFNRGTLSTASHAGSDVQTTYDAGSFYLAGVASNSYSKAMHDAETNGNAYGFAFDDVAEFSPSINADSPTAATMTVAPFQASATGQAMTAPVSTLFGHNNSGGYSDDPVNVATGNFTDTEPVASFPGAWAPGTSLTYNSLDTSTGAFGVGWSSLLSESVTAHADGSAQVKWPDGSTADYTTGGSGFIPPPGMSATLAATSPGWVVSRPDGTSEMFDALGRVTSFADGNGRTVTVARDGTGQATGLTGSDGYSLSLTYSSAGQITQVRTSDGRITALTYDTSARLATITDAGAGVRTFGYDTGGHLASITDPDANAVVTNTYDTSGRVTRQDRPGVPTEVFTYDAAGGASEIDDASGNLVVRYAHDAAGRLTVVAAADGTTATRSYNSAGLLAATVDRTGASTSTAYTTAGLIASVTVNAASTTYAYDSAGRTTQVTDAAGGVTGYTYSGTARIPTSVNLPAGSTRTFTVSGAVVTASTDADGHTSTYTYDSHGNLASLTTASGAVTTYTYDGAGRLISTTAADGGVSRYTYDGMGRLTKQVGPTGAITATTYTLAGRVASTTDPDGHTTSYTYDVAGRLATTTSPSGGVSRYTYDARGDLTQIVDGAGVTTVMTYDTFGRLAATTRAGTTMTYTYDADGNRTAVSVAGQSQTSQYDDAGNTIATTDAAGNTSRFVYDMLGRLVRSTAADGTVSSATYDATGNVVTATDPLGRTRTNTYSPAGEVTATTDPMGYTTRYSYDGDGRLTTVTTPGNHTWTYAYDSAGRQTSTTSPTGLVTSRGYDMAGRSTSITPPGVGPTSTTFTAAGLTSSVTDPAGGAATYTYDSAGRLASATDAALGQTTYGYDVLGRETSQTDPRGAITEYTYTAGGQLATITDPLARVTTYTYDPRGHLTQVSTPDGKSISYTYDTVGDLVSRKDPDGTTVSWTYDALSRRTSMVDATGTTTYAYDPAGQLTRIGEPGGTAFTFTYDGDGRTATTTYPDGTIVSAGHDPDGNLVAISDNHGNYLAYSLDPDGRVTQEHSSAGATRTFTYLGSLLSKYTEQLGATAPTTATSLARDVTGRVTTATTGSATTSYSYDKAGQLTSTTPPAGPASTYTYDSAGNRATTVSGTTTDTYAYDAANQLTAITRNGAPYSALTYDPNGRLTAQSNNGSNTLTLAYNGAGQPVNITRSGPGGSQSATLTRDGDNNPVTVATSVQTPGTTAPSTATTTLRWLTTNGLPQPATVATTTSAVTTSTDLLYGTGGTRVLALTNNAAADLSRDAYGSALPTPTTNALVAQTGYDGFGANPLATGPPAVPVGFSYRGQLTVADTPLMRDRAYDPNTGRFTAPDPLAPIPGAPATTTPYPYANNDPLNLIDPTGDRALNDATFNQNCNGFWGCTGAITGNFIVALGAGALNGVTNVVTLGHGTNLDGCVFGNAGAAGAACTAGKVVGFVGVQVALAVLPGVGEEELGADAIALTARSIDEATTLTRTAADTAGGIGPVVQGAAGVERTIADLEAAGGKVLGREISVDVNGVRTRPDLFAEFPNGQQGFIEVKTGAGARLTPNQSTGFPGIRSGGAVPAGDNAAGAGLAPGVPLGPKSVWIVRQPWPLG